MMHCVFLYVLIDAKVILIHIFVKKMSDNNLTISHQGLYHVEIQFSKVFVICSLLILKNGETH
jgi:uncharacterized membrane protein